MRSEKNIVKLIRSQETKTDPQTRDKILAGAFAQLDEFAAADRSARPMGLFHRIMSSRITQLAAAAGIIIAIFITADYIGNPVQICTIALAQVSDNSSLEKFIDQVLHVNAFTYCYRRHTLNGRPDGQDRSETVLYIMPDHGVRLGTYVDGKTEMRTFLLPAEKVKITVLPEEKQYKKDELSEQTFSQVQREKDPRGLIKQFLSSDYRDLGCAMIDGIQSHGIEVANPGFFQDTLKNVVGRLWINVKTQLPVRMELEGTDIATSNRIRIVTDEFRWEAGLQKDDLGPFIPKDYVLEEPNKKE